MGGGGISVPFLLHSMASVHRYSRLHYYQSDQNANAQLCATREICVLIRSRMYSRIKKWFYIKQEILKLAFARSSFKFTIWETSVVLGMGLDFGPSKPSLNSESDVDLGKIQDLLRRKKDFSTNIKKQRSESERISRESRCCKTVVDF